MIWHVLIISHPLPLRMKNVSDKFVEKIKTNFLFKNIFSNTVFFMAHCGKIWYSLTDRWQSNKAHVLCMLGNNGYKYILSKCNAYCFYTATMVIWARLIVTWNTHCPFICCNSTLIWTWKVNFSLSAVWRHIEVNVSFRRPQHYILFGPIEKQVALCVVHRVRVWGCQIVLHALRVVTVTKTIDTHTEY